MPSSLITSINSALDDTEFLEILKRVNIDSNYICRMLRLSLRNLKTFALCARKLDNNEHLRPETNNNSYGCLGSFFLRIQDAVGKNAREIRSDSSGSGGRDFDTIMCCAVSFRRDIKDLEDEVDEWYITMSDYTRQLSFPVADEVVEIIDSVFENLMYFLRSPHFYNEIFLRAMDTLAGQMQFLKNFILFVSQGSVEHRQMEDFVTHVEAVAISAAHLCFMCRVEEFDEEWWQVMQSKITILLQKIKPVDPRVYDTYAQALSGSKSFRRLHAPTQDIDADTIIVTRNFLNSLICDLWEILRLDTSCVLSMKDQLQVLYEGLRFLRTILEEKPMSKLNEKVRHLTRDVICDAGVVLFSRYVKDVKIDLGPLDFLEIIKVIEAEVEEKVSQASTFNFPKTDELGFVDFLIENLMELTSCAAPIAKSHAQTVKEELVFLRSFLGEILELRNEQEELQALWNRVLEVAYRVEFVIDHLVVGDISDPFSMLFDSIMEDIRSIKAEALKIFGGERQDIQVKKLTRTSSHAPSQSSPSVSNEVVGFHNETASIIDRLTRGSKKLQIIAISGMAGLGKTTLAAKVYKDPFIMRHFNVCAWCPISQEFNKKRVFLELLNQIDRGKYSEMTEEDLAEKLRRCLKGRRYLIFLDDVWTIEVWQSLEGSFPNDFVGSRIILTSRLHDVAPHAMLDQDPHFLRPLTKDESWELLRRKLCAVKDWPPASCELGMQIAENCKGLPLTIVIVAGLLATTEQEGWKEILDGLRSGIVSSTEQCMNTLELSYKHLPDYLKPCLLYFVVFPEDQEVSARRLIRLWIAEGFIRKCKLKSLEDVAEYYMKDLIGRSLIMVSKQRYNGGVKACRVHDLLLDFCSKKAKEEHFFHFLQGYDELYGFNEPCNLRRLCIRSEPQHFVWSRLFCPRARSLLFSSGRSRLQDENWLDISLIIDIFKLLRVLDIEGIHLGSEIPSEIERLVQLKYLAIRGWMRVIPSSIGNLSNLETFIVDSEGRMVSLPDTLWNLQKLKYFYIRGYHYCVGGKYLDNSSILHELNSFSGAIISWDSMEKQMRKFPNIRKLKCKLVEEMDDLENVDKIIALEFLSQLESLHMCGFLHDIDFGLPGNLKKLTLSGFRLPWRKISTIGKLPNLEVLKLLDDSFTGETWEMEEGDFPKLRFLTLSSLNIVRWTASEDDQFAWLEKLVLDKCENLEEMPGCFETISTLDMIEVSYCSDTTISLVNHIGEEQVNMGNSALRILIRRSE